MHSSDTLRKRVQIFYKHISTTGRYVWWNAHQSSNSTQFTKWYWQHIPGKQSFFDRLGVPLLLSVSMSYGWVAALVKSKSSAIWPCMFTMWSLSIRCAWLLNVTMLPRIDDDPDSPKCSSTSFTDSALLPGGICSCCSIALVVSACSFDVVSVSLSLSGDSNWRCMSSTSPSSMDSADGGTWTACVRGWTRVICDADDDDDDTAWSKIVTSVSRDSITVVDCRQWDYTRGVLCGGMFIGVYMRFSSAYSLVQLYRADSVFSVTDWMPFRASMMIFHSDKSKCQIDCTPPYDIYYTT